MAEIQKCWTCEVGRTGRNGCRHTSTMQGGRDANCLSWSQCFWRCSNVMAYPPWSIEPGEMPSTTNREIDKIAPEFGDGIDVLNKGTSKRDNTQSNDNIQEGSNGETYG